MASTTLTTIDPALKQIYKPGNYRHTTYSRRPMFGIIPKSEDFGGRNQPLVQRYGNPQGVSAAFSTAQSNATSMKLEDFVLTRVSMHSVATMDGDAVEATAEDKYAFLNGLVAKIDSAMDALSDVIESYMPRAGTGAIGRISSTSTVTNQTVTLDPIDEAHNFEVGMRLASATSETAAVSTGSATGEVLAGVNRITGVITATSAQWDTVITGIAASDYLFRHGDAYNNTANIVPTGFIGWVPAATPASTAFFGVDRTADSRLYGSYYDGSSGSVKEAIINGQSQAGSLGGAIDQVFMHNTKFRRFKVEIGTQEWYEKHAKGPKGDVAEVSFQGLRVMGDYGPIDVTPANKCQPTLAWGLELDTWEYPALGAHVRLNNLDGNRILRQASADGVEVRVVSRGQIGCKNPGRNVQILLPS